MTNDNDNHTSGTNADSIDFSSIQRRLHSLFDVVILRSQITQRQQQQQLPRIVRRIIIIIVRHVVDHRIASAHNKRIVLMPSRSRLHSSNDPSLPTRSKRHSRPTDRSIDLIETQHRSHEQHIRSRQANIDATIQLCRHDSNSIDDDDDDDDALFQSTLTNTRDATLPPSFAPHQRIQANSHHLSLFFLLLLLFFVSF